MVMFIYVKYWALHPTVFKLEFMRKLGQVKGDFAIQEKKKVNCQCTLTVDYTIQYQIEKRKKNTNFVHLQNRAGQQDVQANRRDPENIRVADRYTTKQIYKSKCTGGEEI